MDDDKISNSLDVLAKHAEERRKASLENAREWPPADLMQWQGEQSGLRIAVTSHHIMLFGTVYCGYVRVPSDHVAFGKWYDEVECEVHGGLTFCQLGADGGFWFGFDCGHYDDMGRWNLESCTAETRRMADQFAAMK